MPHLFPKPFPLQPQDLKAHLDCDQHDDRPLQEQTVLLTQPLPEHTSNLCGVVHLLVQHLDPHSDIQCPPYLIIVILEIQLVPTIPEKGLVRSR